MNDEKGGNQGLGRARALAVADTVAVPGTSRSGVLSKRASLTRRPR